MEKKNFGTMISALREEKKMSLSALAEAAKKAGFKRKVSTTFLSKVESGQTVPSVKIIEALAKALSASLKPLLDQAREDAIVIATEKINKRFLLTK